MDVVPDSYKGILWEEILKYKKEIKKKMPVLENNMHTQTYRSSLTGSDDGYTWNISSYEEKVSLCKDLSNGRDEWQFYYDLLNTVYDTDDTYILEQSIASMAGMGSAMRQ